MTSNTTDNRPERCGHMRATLQHISIIASVALTFANDSSDALMVENLAQIADLSKATILFDDAMRDGDAPPF